MKAGLALGILALVLSTASVGAGLVLGTRNAQLPSLGPPAAQAAATPAMSAPAPSATAAAPVPPAPAPAARSAAALAADVTGLLRSAGATGGVSLIELAGTAPVSWSLNGGQAFVAASTYKLPLLMMDAQDIALGRASPGDQLCYESSDWEDGYYSDYSDGECFTRAELERRAGIDSDNTAAHILVRYDGGTDALNAFARAHGAMGSAFYDPNTTTSDDLARLWQNEAAGNAGGTKAQAYLYPLLTHTAYEDGIPAGVPAGTTVAHKIGILDSEINDAGLVLTGPRGSYALAICTEDGSWQLVADIARAVAGFER